MLSQMVGETPYDLRWRMFGISCASTPCLGRRRLRVLGSLQFGIGACLVGIACVFFSILLHEMGHVLMGRVFGTHGDIILWAFGGLAVHSTDVRRRWQRLAVLFAGPLIQLIFWGLLELALNITLCPRSGSSLRGISLVTAISMLLWINLYWAILNLLPIWPLDGGQITRNYSVPSRAERRAALSLQLSIGLAGLRPCTRFMGREGKPPLLPYLPTGTHNGIFSLIFAGIGIQALQIEYAQRRSFDPWDHHEPGNGRSRRGKSPRGARRLNVVAPPLREAIFGRPPRGAGDT